MSTGAGVHRVPARAALAGNPSDGYGGRVVAVPIQEFHATARLVTGPATGAVGRGAAGAAALAAPDPELARLIGAARRRLFTGAGIDDPGTPVAVETRIPREVGLAGSSAVIIAVLRALAAASAIELAPTDLAVMALAVEVDDLGIGAGLQDRLVQAHDRALDMDFGATAKPVGDHRYRATVRPIDVDGLPLFVAWKAAAAESSGVVHGDLRARFDTGDAAVRAAMVDLAQAAAVAVDALAARDLEQLGWAMGRSFDLRASVCDLHPDHAEMVAVARASGAAVNYAGSGGSIVGLVPAEGPDRVIAALTEVGCSAVVVASP